MELKKSRSSHKKSKAGCVICKRRRVKCDEGHPQCFNCIKYGKEKCEYPQLALSDHSPFPNSIPGPSQPVPPSLRNDSKRITEYSILYNQDICPSCGAQHYNPYSAYPHLNTEFPSALPACTLYLTLPFPTTRASFSHSLSDPHTSQFTSADLNLRYHFITTTSPTLIIAPAGEEVAREKPSQLAWSLIACGNLSTQYTFAAHAIFATAAAHLDTADSIQLAEHHYRLALLGLTKEFTTSGITQENCDAICATTIMCSVTLLSNAGRSFTKPSSNIPLSTSAVLNESDRLDTQWISYARGAINILLEGSKMSSIFEPFGISLSSYPHTLEMTRTLPIRTENMLQQLESLSHDCELGPRGELDDMNTATAYFSVSWNLRRLWAVLDEWCNKPFSLNSKLPNESNHPYGSRKGALRQDYLCSSICQFIVRTSPRFWECLEQRRPRALIMYAYYVVCWESLNFGTGLSQYQGLWWLQGKVQRDLTALQNELDLLTVNSSSGITKELGDRWMWGAWEVSAGLRYGWWFDSRLEGKKQQVQQSLHSMSTSGANYMGIGDLHQVGTV